MYKFLYNEKEIKRFFNKVMPALKDFEVYFISLSARNKYLSEDLRKDIKLSGTEMIEKRVIREKSYIKFLRTLKKFECEDGAFTDKNGNNIPNDCMTIYMNINPSNMVKALNKFQHTVNDYTLLLSTPNWDRNEDEKKKFIKIDNLLMSCIQESKGTKTWLDIDLDIPKGSEMMFEISVFIDNIKNKGAKGLLIDTRSGFHVLLKKETLAGINLQEYLNTLKLSLVKEKVDKTESLDEILKTRYNMEVIINKNEMIPVPGTFQGGYPVRIIEEF